MSVSPTPDAGRTAQRRRWATLWRWFDTSTDAAAATGQPQRVDWVRAIPFAAMHLACLAVIWVGVSWVAVGVAVALYAVRMFAITAFYHR
ncbi:MAG TPA: acyl-CoA desaturase, partial [Stenotrophomonas sp.]|nr:acyl-CoA desaturase [Stenotrophomonas sp.]